MNQSPLVKQKAWLEGELDRLRAERIELERLAQEAGVRDGHLISDLRAELAAKDARIAHERVEGDKILAALEMANVRIAESEATRLHWTGEVARLTQNSCDDRGRAERAEAELKAVRELLDWIYGFLAFVDSYHSRTVQDRAERAEARVAEFADKGTLQALRDANDRAECAEAEVKRLMGLLDSEEMDVLIQQERAERAEAKVAEAKEQAHYDNGVADLAMKHRNSAEAERDTMREVLESTLLLLEDVFSEADQPDTEWGIKMISAIDKARASLAPSPADQG